MANRIEITAKPGLPLGMPPARFLRNYWQKRPLLIRQAFPNFTSPITPNDLAGLACEELAYSRLIQHEPKSDQWSLRSGPLGTKDFAKLPKSHWTLLVQDVDKWDTQVQELLQTFRFLPDWRIDDIMISYAVRQGSVGAHVDNYDVFLLQGMGQRRWLIDIDPHAPKAFREDTELKLLKQFMPSHEWLLQPGDMLYLPPNLPHHGIAENECLTFSIGMRAPSRAELLGDFADFLAEQISEEQRYCDPDLAPAHDSAEIDLAAIQRLKSALLPLQTLDSNQLCNWFGAFITRYRNAQTPAPRPRPLTHQALDKHLLRDTRLQRNPWTRLAYARTHANADLYATGQRYHCSLPLAQSLCRDQILDIAHLLPLNKSDTQTLLTLINDGHFGFVAK